MNNYLIIFDTISTLLLHNNTNTNNITVYGNIFVKDAVSRTIIYRSPYYVEHIHTTSHQFKFTDLSQFTTENYAIIDSDQYSTNQLITIEL